MLKKFCRECYRRSPLVATDFKHIYTKFVWKAYEIQFPQAAFTKHIKIQKVLFQNRKVMLE